MSVTTRELAFVLTYFAVYLGYLFARPEGELLHWLTLVLLPLAGLAVCRRDRSVIELIRSIGLDTRYLTHGMGWGLLFGAAFQVLQLLNRRQRSELLALLQHPIGPLLPLGAFGLLLVTVATTEEVFFRGILQTRLASASRRPLLALVLTTVAFSLYHIPYAYLKPSWPSFGDFEAAVRLAFANGGVGGFALGFVYLRGRGNLLAPIVLHAFIDLIPATRLVARLAGIGS